MSWDYESSAIHELFVSERPYSLKKGSILQTTDSFLVMTLIDSGYVKRYIITDNGTQSIQSIYGPGDFIPLTQVFRILFDIKLSDSPETIYYETMSNVTARSLSDDDFGRAIKDNDLMYRDVLFHAAKRFRSNIFKLENDSLKNAYYKVAHQLFFLAQEFGTDKSGLTEIPLKLTHQDLANLLNLTRETITNCIAKLKQKKIIRIENSLFMINKAELYKEIYSVHT